jgi:hypothetical protein
LQSLKANCIMHSMNTRIIGQVFITLAIFFWLIKAQVGLSNSDDDTFLKTKVGSKVTVYNSGGDYAIVAVDKDSFNRVLDLIYANDTTTMKVMYLAGKLFTVDNNTPVLVLDKAVFNHNQSVFKIRVLKGQNADKVGWLPARATR